MEDEKTEKEGPGQGRGGRDDATDDFPMDPQQADAELEQDPYYWRENADGATRALQFHGMPWHFTRQSPELSLKLRINFTLVASNSFRIPLQFHSNSDGC